MKRIDNLDILLLVAISFGLLSIDMSNMNTLSWTAFVVSIAAISLITIKLFISKRMAK